MCIYLIKIVGYVFNLYTCFLAVRIIGSWFPQLTGYKWMQFIGFYTDPYLNLFRRLIPPLGGRLDLSPILAFLGLEFLKSMVVGLIVRIFC